MVPFPPPGGPTRTNREEKRTLCSSDPALLALFSMAGMVAGPKGGEEESGEKKVEREERLEGRKWREGEERLEARPGHSQVRASDRARGGAVGK